MRDAQYHIRRAAYAVLNGNVNYNGSPVGFYDERRRAEGDVYCLFGTQQSTAVEENDCTWITQEDINIEIWHQTDFEVSKDFIDDVSDQVYRLMIPSVMTGALTPGTNMQIVNVSMRSAITRAVELTPTETVVGKIITFTMQVIQQS